MSRVRRRVRKVGRIVLCLLMVGIFALGPTQVQTRMAFAQAEAKQAAELKKLAEKLEKVFEALEELAREIPRDTFDPQAIVDKVGKDPEKLFEWVRGNTDFVPYAGVLRGHKGVLMDRLGNSLDRSLLLGELLRLAGFEARLVLGNLSDAQARGILETIPPISKRGLATEERQPLSVRKTAADYAARFGLDASQLGNQIEQARVQSQRLAEEAVQRVAAQTPELAKAVSGHRLDERPNEIARKRLAAIRLHFWIQWQAGERWVDLDPTLPDAVVGRTLAKALKRYAPKDPNVPLELAIPNKLKHRVTIRVIIERWEEGRLVQKPVLQASLTPYRRIGQRIALHHVALNSPGVMEILESQDPVKALHAAAVGPRDWMPVLSLGGDRIQRYSFTDTGQINEFPLLASGSVAGENRKALDSMTGWINRIGSAESTKLVPKILDAPQGPAQLTAEWVEYSIESPGRRARKIRRQVFDLLGPAAREQTGGEIKLKPFAESQRLARELALLGGTEMLMPVCQFSPEFVDFSVAESVVRNGAVQVDLLKNWKGTDLEQVGEALAKLDAVPGRLFAFALARWEWSRNRTATYLDQPNVACFVTQFHGSSEGAIVVRRGFDIVANDIAVDVHGEGSEFLARLEQGVLDTNVEALLASANGDAVVENVAEILSASRGQGIPWLTVADPDDRRLAKVMMTEDMRTRIARDLADGYAVTLPQRAVRMGDTVVQGWWRVDRKTGQTLGIGPDGTGAAGEYTALQRVYFGLIVGHFSAAACMLGAAEKQRKATGTRKITPEQGLMCVVYGVIAGATGGRIGKNRQDAIYLAIAMLFGGGAAGYKL